MNTDPSSGTALALHAYAEAVSCALDTPVRTVDCDVQRTPAMVLFVLDGHVPTFPELDWLLTWDEVNGWASRIRTTDDGETATLSFLGGCLLPAPHDVGQFVHEVAANAQPGQLLPPEFRLPDASDGLEHDLGIGTWARNSAPPE